ncbi:MAG TPA: RND transporter [Thiolapillus brandeum]|uniref:RND transporter n=1 Tax=Thiolapillus brandeum TaxID=1076588 RepID=A0A831K2U9_9GAMM|nr:RND transporter [Thiolapillus brandeum]
MKWIDEIPLGFLVLAALFFGLMPFTPEPHVWEKIKMLATGELVRPLDIFDMVLHGTPWVLLGIKLWREAQHKRDSDFPLG